MVAVFDAQWAAVPTYPLPKVLSRTVMLLPGLPAPGKDSMAGVVKLWLEDAWLTHHSMYEPDEPRHIDWSASLSSAAASLSGNSWDAVFIAFEAPSMCGSGGCTTHILHRTDQGLHDIRCADCPRSKLLSWPVSRVDVVGHAVDGQCLARQHARAVRGEKQGKVSNVFWCGQALKRRA